MISPAMLHAKVAFLVLLGLVSIMGAPTILHAAAPITPYAFHIEKQWNIGGAGGWGRLTLDQTTHSLYIPRTDRLTVVDIETGKVSGEVTGFINARDIALDDTGKFGYVTDLTDGTAGFVRVFDRINRKLLTSIPVGLTPDAIAFDHTTRTIFVFNTSARSASVIDSVTNQVVATIALPGRPSSALSDDKGAIFVAMRGLSQIIRIDAAARTISAAWPLAPCVGPIGLAIDRANRQLFSACENHQLITVNADTGRVASIGEVEEGARDVRFDPRHHLLFIANSSGTLTIFRGNQTGKFAKMQELNTLPGAQALAISSEEGTGYLATARFGQRTGTTSEELRYRPTPEAGSFTVLVVSRRTTTP